MEIFDELVNKLSNPELTSNLAEVSTGFLLAFFIALFLTPLVSRFARAIGVVDMPKEKRGKNDKTANRRIHEGVLTRLGGLSTAIAIVISVIALDYLDYFPRGVLLGFLIVVVVGFLDVKYEINARLQLLGQVIAAMFIIVGGNTILGIDIGVTNLDFNWYSDLVFEFGNYTYNFIFPADIITLLWIVGMINAINWVGGIDGLNGSVSGIAAFTMLLIVLDKENPDIALAAMIGIYLGGLLGMLPYNWYPQKMMPGSIGDYLNGYLLAVFAIFSSTRWLATFTILGLPLIDALLVIWIRFRQHPETRKNPLKILSISDKNHLHHRLLAAGYSKKMVVLIEIAMMLVLCTIAFWFSGIEREYFAAFASASLIVVAFAIIAFLVKRNQRKVNLKLITQDKKPEVLKDATVNIITDPDSKPEEDDYERFIY